jgi:hypothetical protein
VPPGDVGWRGESRLKRDMTHHFLGKAVVAAYAISVVGILAGCSSGPSSQDAAWKLVPVSDVNKLVGEWEGPVKKEHATFSEGSVRLIIRANNTYLFAGQTAAKVAVGSGELEPKDGRLVGNSDRRTVTFTLYDHKGKSVVLVEATNHDTGEHYRGELTKLP